ncbi:hypothetical protein SEUCBS139899_001102 [Sporothrix eucalyptigena]|uniref:Indole-diterpene biosynthesis protein n=1 Tax=Sporothrix eucalyptigena TaxID=1812306 RepID=A0ABP0B5L1_9PEZI
MTDTPDTKPLVDPLGFMEKLSSSVYIYRPASSTATTSPTSTTPRKAPKLVIITAWMGARPAHVAKYIVPYRDGLVFGEPESERPAIALLFCHEKTTSSYSKAAVVGETVLPFIQDVLGDSLEATDDEASPDALTVRSAAPQMLVHTLSNGGCLILGHIYNAIDPEHRKCLPPHVTMFDSCPGHFRFAGAATAFSMGLAKAPLAKRLVLLPAIYLLVFSMLVRIRGERALAWLANLGRSLMRSLFGVQPSPKPPGPSRALNPWTPHNVNTVFGGNRREVRRTYLYSNDDKIIEARDVEEHANEAKGLGFTVFRMAEFPKSNHVAHARADGPRYWATIKDTWLGTSETV